MRELKVQFANALLVVLTVAAAVSAFVNFQQNFDPEKRFRLPEDGVTWVDRKAAGRPQCCAGAHRRTVTDPPNGRHQSGRPAPQNSGRPDRRSHRRDSGAARGQAVPESQIHCGAARHRVHANVIVGERTPDYSLYYQYLIGLAYLGIGLFVYFRRGNAPKSLHFLVLCLVSFVLSTFHYTGKLNNFDKVIYWGNVAAGIFAPTIFLHFCLTFPEPRGWLRGRGRVPLIYLPGTVLLAITVAIGAGNLRVDISPVELRWLLDRALLGYLASCICWARWC